MFVVWEDFYTIKNKLSNPGMQSVANINGYTEDVIKHALKLECFLLRRMNQTYWRQKVTLNVNLSKIFHLIFKVTLHIKRFI